MDAAWSIVELSRHSVPDLSVLNHPLTLPSSLNHYFTSSQERKKRYYEQIVAKTTVSPL